MSEQFCTDNILIKIINKECTIPTQKNGSRIISFYNNQKEKILLPFKRETIDTGYILSFSKDWILSIVSDPMISQLNGVSVIHRFYERSKDNPLLITLFNTSDTRIVISPKQKIAEGILIPAGQTTLQVVKNIEF